MINWLRNVGEWLRYGGSPAPRSYEESILERVASELPAEDARALLAQVRSVHRVQRYLGDRMVLFHFKPNTALPTPLSPKGEAHCLAKLRFEGAGGRATAAVVTHRGILSSLEFTRPPKALFVDGIHVISVTTGGKWQGPAEAADRLEHGGS